MSEGPPYIRRFLDLSTAHLPEHLGTDLAGTDGVIAYKIDEYGWLMWVPSHEADIDDPPPEVITVQRYARYHGCDYVLFDCDANIDENLPTWTW